MGRRKITGARLAKETGLSATSVSRIIKGHSKPKQVTLTRLMKRLCLGRDDEQMLLRAFTGLESVIEEPLADDPRNSLEERERVERWLEARTQAITFKNAIARELDKSGIVYRRDVCDDIASTDFLIEIGTTRIAVECKFNVSRDFEKTVGIAQLLRVLLKCDQALIVVPFVSDFAGSYPAGVRVVTVSEAISLLKEVA